MDADAFEQTLKQLLEEFEKSGKSVDEFMKEKLTAAGRKDADQCVAEISGTLNDIDEKYASLQKCKAEGGNREEWLRSEIDDLSKDYSPEETGKVLSSTIKVLNHDKDDIPDENASYNALDAAFLIKDLDDALVKNVCTSINSTEEK